MLFFQLNSTHSAIALDVLHNKREALVHIDAPRVERNARTLQGLFELSFSVEADSYVLNSRNFMLVIAFPWGETHYLGPLTTAKVASARFCKKVPRTFALLLLEDTCIPSDELPPLPAEMLLKEHVKIILENEEFGGSLPSSHVQNLVRELPFYNDGISRFKSWSTFVTFFSKYYGSWSLLGYDDDSNEYYHPVPSALAAPLEIRLVANKFCRECARFDLNRDYQRLHALRNLYECVAPLYNSSNSSSSSSSAGTVMRNLTKSELRKLSTNSNFLLLNSVNYINIIKMMSQKPYNVLFSPLHPIAVNIIPNAKKLLDTSQITSA